MKRESCILHSLIAIIEGCHSSVKDLVMLALKHIVELLELLFVVWSLLI